MVTYQRGKGGSFDLNIRRHSMEILGKSYIITMPNGEKWSVPVVAIFLHKAVALSFDEDDFHVDGEALTKRIVEAVLAQARDSMRVDKQIINTAKNHIRWDDIKYAATQLTNPTPARKDGWIDGEVEIV